MVVDATQQPKNTVTLSKQYSARHAPTLHTLETPTLLCCGNICIQKRSFPLTGANSKGLINLIAVEEALGRLLQVGLGNTVADA